MSQYKTARVPVLLKGAAENWPLMSKWDKDYIIAHMGNYVCKVIKDSRPAYSKEQTTLKFYFEKLKDVSTLTLDPFNSKKPPRFFKDVTCPNPYFIINDIQRFFFFHSVKDAGTLPHIHGNAFNILQNGTKEWVFYDASETHNPNGYQVLKASNKKYNVGSHAKDWFKKEVPKLPQKLDKVYRCTQEAGDIVFIPEGYCHAVLNKSEVMGIVFETR
ncbi:MAG: hypothetical protein GYB32_07250 [Algicola sp.]|nr:hypothetical protein [Algicola sp.]